MNALIEEHTISHLDSTRTDNKEMESPENFCYRNGFNNLLRKLNVIIEKIKLKRQKAKKKKMKNGMIWLFKEVCPGTTWRTSNLFLFSKWLGEKIWMYHHSIKTWLR